MANTEIYWREVRILIEEELTQVYVRCDAYVDVPIGIQGWHHKTFPASVSCFDFFKMWNAGLENPVLWSQQAPPSQ